MTETFESTWMNVYPDSKKQFTKMEVRIIKKNDKDKMVIEGKITEAFPGAKFNVELQNGHEITGYVSGKMRRHNIRILLGDRVKVELTPYDLDLGRITYRYKRGEVRKMGKSLATS